MEKTTKIIQVGHSLAIIITKEMADEWDVKKGDTVLVRLGLKEIHIRKG